MGMRRDAQLKELEHRISYHFKDQRLLDRACTHASAQQTFSNERLEFLGDRVLGLVIAEFLHNLPQHHTEGNMATRLNHVVRGEVCASIAARLGVGKYLIGRALDQDGHIAKSILADAMEAIIAAVYLDGGIKEAREFIMKHWSDILSENQDDFRDPKSRLQEHSQAHGLGLPVYQVIHTTGPDHAPIFTVEVSLMGNQTAVAEGGSKREAERLAASRLLEKLEKSDAT